MRAYITGAESQECAACPHSSMSPRCTLFNQDRVEVSGKEMEWKRLVICIACELTRNKEGT